MTCAYICSILPLLGTAALLKNAVDVNDLVRRSVAATEADWQVAPRYQYRERDVKGRKIETYEVTMIDGSPFYRLIARNDHPLSPEEAANETTKFQAEINKRRRENSAQRAKRLAAYQRERDEDHLFLKETADAFSFRLQRTEVTDRRSVFVLEATPRPEYRPPNTKAKVLTHMRGTLWIDQVEYQWVKVEAEVTAPVSLYLVAHVGPGTRFSLEQMPIGKHLWLPKRFTMQAKVTILGVPRERKEEETYSGYRLIDAKTANGNGDRLKNRSAFIARLFATPLFAAANSSESGRHRPKVSQVLRQSLFDLLNFAL